ncbi:MAG: phosphoribosylformylglycinamidine synthase subunit PurQ [Actinomycetota bacterium]|nr:phosphoribosylformylglycinamidine synthase subunit PurQ [Actinomycetota bacterium]
MHFGVVVFPGSNCDGDCYYVIKDVLGKDVDYVWHKSTDVSRFDCLVLPGGSSYGDYLRTGAIARFSPVVEAIRRFAEGGGLVVGIGNGFQILLESGLLPGAMMRNRGLKFICRFVNIRVENACAPWTSMAKTGQVLRIPIAHNEGNYQAPPDVLEKMEERGQIIFRYCSPEGEVSDEFNPNGAIGNIAGITNEEGNVLGLMPHPERASEEILGSSDGLFIWDSILAKLEGNTK